MISCVSPLGDFLQEWADVYGNTFNFRIMFENRVSVLEFFLWVGDRARPVLMVNEQFFTAEPDHIKAILATQFEDFEKGEVSFFLNILQYTVVGYD
jgi:hypothetical protein